MQHYSVYRRQNNLKSSEQKYQNIYQTITSLLDYYFVLLFHCRKSFFIFLSVYEWNFLYYFCSVGKCNYSEFSLLFLWPTTVYVFFCHIYLSVCLNNFSYSIWKIMVRFDLIYNPLNLRIIISDNFFY